jgi:hypothetical protein
MHIASLCLEVCFSSGISLADSFIVNEYLTGRPYDVQTKFMKNDQEILIYLHVNSEAPSP